MTGSGSSSGSGSGRFGSGGRFGIVLSSSSASEPSSAAKKLHGGNIGFCHGSGVRPLGAYRISFAISATPFAIARSASASSSASSRSSSAFWRASYASSFVIRAAMTRSARFCSVVLMTSPRKSASKYARGSTAESASNEAACATNASSSASISASETGGYSTTWRNTNAEGVVVSVCRAVVAPPTNFDPPRVVNVVVVNVPSAAATPQPSPDTWCLTAAALGMTSASGASGNAGTDGVLSVGMAATRPARAGSGFLGSATRIVAGGAGVWASLATGVRNEWLTTSGSGPATFALVYAHRASASRDARYAANVDSGRISKKHSWSGYATNASGATSGARIGGGPRSDDADESSRAGADADDLSASAPADSSSAPAGASSSAPGVDSSSAPAGGSSSAPADASPPVSSSSPDGGGGFGSRSSNAHRRNTRPSCATKHAGANGRADASSSAPEGFDAAESEARRPEESDPTRGRPEE